MEGWVKEPTVNSYAVPFSYGYSATAGTYRWAMQIQNSVGTYVNVAGGDPYVFNYLLADTSWHFYASVLPAGATIDSSILLYVDGVPKTGSCYSEPAPNRLRL